ncbi:TnsD family Tn7-like transposition protein [Pseudomonas sp. zjy_14]|uniref:TnsD family Tn7-like transposition protein n=1 Tax=Pseudomonas sp. zjy_14 TaxID=3367264 RepID=UPI00370C38C3
MALKFHFFPAVFPDETLHSVLSRYARLCGGGSRKAVFAGERAAVSFTQNVAFPTRLSDLVELLPRGTELSVTEIIKRHTVLPYYAPFLSSEQLQYAQASMAGCGKGLMLKLGVNASRIEAASRVRLCPACVSEDILHVGAAYWHRVHQLPGVLVCPHHRRVLNLVSPNWYGRNSRQLFLPDDVDDQAHMCQLDVPERCVPALHQIAEQSLQLLTAELKAIPAASLRASLLHDAADLDLATAKGRLDLLRLSEYLKSFFQSLPTYGEYLILRGASEGLPATWVTKLLRKPRRTHHPLKYIVLATALKIDLAHILSCHLPLQPEVKPCRETHAIAEPNPPIQMLNDEPQGGRAAVWTHALVGESAETIASTLGVSQVYVYRCIRAVNGGSNAWREAKFIKVRSEKRAKFEADIRLSHAHDCRGYAWLHRRDRAWLTECIANHRGKNAKQVDRSSMFAALDAKLAEQITKCAKALRSTSGKPVRVSRTRIGRELHAQSRFEKQRSKLPLCEKALADACETSDEFHARRLLWAETVLVENEVPMTWSGLYRTAGIRPPKRIHQSEGRCHPSHRIRGCYIFTELRGP